MKNALNQIFTQLFQSSSKHKLNNAEFGDIFPNFGILSNVKVKRLEELVDTKINNPAIFEQAFIHRSYLQISNEPSMISNERLEFLGDAIIDMIAAEYLFFEHKLVLEGELTKMRALIVNKNALAFTAKVYNLKDYLIMSYSAEKAIESGSDNMLGDAMEALIAAVYIDSGLEAAKKFVVKKLLPIIFENNSLAEKNYKSILLETLQQVGTETPKYQVLSESGPEHNKTFEVAVFYQEKPIGFGVGRTKKAAEQEAAKLALDDKKYIA